MAKDPADVNGRDGARAARKRPELEANVEALETVLGLLAACRVAAGLVQAGDHKTKADLVNSLALAELDALRLLADEAPERAAELTSGEAKSDF